MADHSAQKFNLNDEIEWRKYQHQMLQNEYSMLKKINSSLGCLVAWFVVLPVGLLILWFLFGISLF